MTIYDLYIFDRHCNCIFYTAWNTPAAKQLALDQKQFTNQSGGKTVSVDDDAENTSSNPQRSSPSKLQALAQSSSNLARAASLSSAALPQPSSASPSSSSQQQQQQQQQQLPQLPSFLTDHALQEQAKLVYGVVYSLRNLVNKLSIKTPTLTNNHNCLNEGFLAYRTSVYKLHYLETPSGFKMVMNTDANTDSVRDVMKTIYAQILVECVVKNPLVPRVDEPITNPLFKTTLDTYVKGLAIYD